MRRSSARRAATQRAPSDTCRQDVDAGLSSSRRGRQHAQQDDTVVFDAHDLGDGRISVLVADDDVNRPRVEPNPGQACRTLPCVQPIGVDAVEVDPQVPRARRDRSSVRAMGPHQS